jgi:hypothetical protein
VHDQPHRADCTWNDRQTARASLSRPCAAFEKASGQYCYRHRRCRILFGRSSIESATFHSPVGRGLANLGDAHYRLMCRHDVVVVESALEDMAHVARGRAEAAVGRANTTERAGAMAGTLGAYAARLGRLMAAWHACEARRERLPRPRFIFMLARAPRSRALHNERRVVDCEANAPGERAPARAWHAHYVAAVNKVARAIVLRAGFEVFDPFALTLHARPQWFDREHGAREYATYEAEALSDMLTQLLINQLCSQQE